MKETKYYVVAEIKGKADYFKERIDNEKDMIEIYKKHVLPLDQEKGEKEIFRCECRIEAFQDALETMERSIKIWEE